LTLKNLSDNLYNMKNQRNKRYQLTCLFNTSADAEKINQIIEEIKQVIISNKGTPSEKNYSAEPVNKKLAYLIKKQNEALYWDFCFSISPKEISKLEHILKQKKNIIRYIIVNKKELKQKPIKKPIDFKIIDKIEPLPKKVLDREEKTKIEDLDKKLEEILNQ